MKRYSPDVEYIGSGDYLPDMKEAPDGDYVLWDDLIATGVLVPVPVGEACDLDDVSTDVWMVVFHRNLYYREEDGYSWAAFSDTAKPRFLQSLSFVQPVKLLPLAELEADHG